MQQPLPNCIHCKSHFELGQTLPPEGIHIEYKKYYLPIKDQQPKWIILKTIVAFLNSKGGTIFIGVDDSTRQVVGLTAELKEQDLFMLDFAQLLEQIKPEVDLRRKEEVKVRFVPVLKDKTFQGKYVIKIIVKQGNPAKVYHFAQTLKFVCQDKRSHDQEFKVLWGFYRSNMGKVDSIKGTELLRQVYEKATNPSIVVQTYHPGCNPEPLQVSVRNMNIGFKNLKNPKLRQMILDCIDRKFKSINLTTTYAVQDCKEDDTFILKFKSITDYKEADACILDNEKEIKAIMEGRDSLIDEGYLDNTHFYKIGLAFNPSLRYLRNKQKSRNKSIDVEKKIYKNQAQRQVKSPLQGSLPPKPNQTANKTNYKPKQQNAKSPLPTDTQQYVKPKNMFVKNLPTEEQGEIQQDSEIGQSQKEESPQKTQPSPAKQFKAKQQDFPQIGTANSPKSNKPSMGMPPKPSSTKESKQSPSKQIISKQQSSNEVVQYSLIITDIYENSYPKLVHYLENSLGNKLDAIPHKIQQTQDNKQINIHFHSLNDIEAFVEGLSRHLHTRKVFHGFGEGKPVTIKIQKGQKLEDFHWTAQNQLKKQQSADKHKRKSHSRQSHSRSKPQYLPKKPQHQSPTKSPAQSFNNKTKQKMAEVKGFPFVITNLRIDLSELEKSHFTALLKQIFKHFCSQNADVKILNEKSLTGIVGLNFESGEQRKSFSDKMQTEIIKYHELTDFFKGHKVYWGIPSGNLIMHHYKADDKNRNAFKEEVQKLFEDREKWQLYESRFVKEENKFFLRLTFHPNNFVQAFEKASQSASQSPIKDYASWKEGIILFAELNRI